MVKLTAQECFDNACVEYEKAKGIIADLTVKTKEIANTFNGEIAMRQFDFILQAILLNLAVEDKEFCELEKIFIKNITEYADILATVNNDIRKEMPDWIDVNWDDIDKLTPENKNKFAAICAGVIARYADEFTYFFSAVDLIDEERDYFEELQQCLFHIIIMLDAVDEGGFDPEKGADDEALRALGVMQNLFNDNWEKNTAKMREALGGN